MSHRADRIHEALRNPAAVFATPEALEHEPTLERAEKLVLLTIWENDARELAVAEDENMGGGEPDLLVEVAAARARLEAEAAEDVASAAHKQGSPAPDPGVFRVRHFMRPLTARDATTAEAASCFADDEVRSARAMMDRHACDHLVVVGPDDAPVGVLARDDLPPLGTASAAGLRRSRTRPQNSSTRD